MANPWEMNWEKPKAEASAPKPWEKDWGKPEASAPVAEQVLSELTAKEGVGDEVTSVETGALGVTEAARKAVGATENTDDTKVAKDYLNVLENKWEGVEGFKDASDGVKKALLDTTYNIGEGVLKFKGVKSALKGGDEEEVVKSLLDTASVDGKAVKGLAKRRAEAYNEVSETPITEVEQLEDGTIIYKKDGEEFFKYKAEGGKHEKSGVGTITVDDN